MRTLSRMIILFFFIVLISVTGLMAQRSIEGTVYMAGKPAPGVTVEVHRITSTALTDFDGKYKIDADAKSKWIKFTAVDGTDGEVKLDENSGNIIDFALTGEIPSGESDGGTDVILKSQEDLFKDDDRDYLTALTLYGQEYEEGKYEEALSNWKIIYNKYPASHDNLYIHGAQIYQALLKKAETDEGKDKLVDELLKMYDKRVKYFGGKGNALARKANALLTYKVYERNNPVGGQEFTDVIKQSYEWLNTVITEDGTKSAVATIVSFMQTSIQLFKLGELPKETIVKNYDLSNKLLNDIIEISKDIIEEKKGTDKEIEEAKERLTNAKDIAISGIEDMFGKSGAADCDALVNIYAPKFEENKDDAGFIKDMIRKLRRACEDNDLIERATVKLYELEPSAEAAFNLAQNYHIKEDIENARKFYLQAIEQETDNALLATYNYGYGLLLYNKDNNYEEARNVLKKAVSLDPSLCKAYMLLGDIYVKASETFSNDNFEKRTVYWIAVDYYNKAKQYEDCSEDATGRISDYKKQFPSREDGFMQDPPLKVGDNYRVGGWINETTTIRF